METIEFTRVRFGRRMSGIICVLQKLARRYIRIKHAIIRAEAPAGTCLPLTYSFRLLLAKKRRDKQPRNVYLRLKEINYYVDVTL